jgi:hypothetical protein
MSARHQAYWVRNRNRETRSARASAPPPITISQACADAEYDASGYLKVVPVRDFDFKVPFEMTEGKFTYAEAVNPINQMGALHEQCVPLVTSNDFHSFLAAFNKRSNFIQGPKDDDIEDAEFRESMDLIRSLPDLFQVWDDNDSDRERWLDKFDSSKRRRMEEAYLTVSDCDADYLGTKDLSVKQEVLIKRDDPEWAPRVIYAGNDAFNAVTGPACMVIMERLVSLLAEHEVGPVKVMLGYKTNDVKLATFLAESVHPDTVEGDFSRNDREQRSRVALLIDAWLGKLGMPQWYRSLLLKLEHYKVQNKRFGFKARLKFQLPTGTTMTTARNSMYNITMYALTCKRQRRKSDAVVLGDDLLARVSKRLDLNAWTQTVANFKMVLKPKAPRLDGEATFLSRRIFANRTEPCMVPLLGKMLVRFNIRATINDSCSDSQYMAGKALSYAYECRHVPTLRDIFLQRYEDEDDGGKVTLDDLTWFARSSGIHDVATLLRSIKEETVIVDEDEFGTWCCETYGLMLVEVEDLFTSTVLDARITMIDSPLLEFMSQDYA